MARLPRVRKGWAVAGLALVALVIAGAVQARFDRRTGRGVASTEASRDAVAPSVGTASGAPSSSSDYSAKAQIAPAPVPPDGGSTAVVPGSPRVVRTADVRVKLGKGAFGAAFDRVAALAAANGGFVQSSSTASYKGARSGELTVRVPADRFDAVRQSLAGLGEVDSQSIRGEDVSGQLVDYGARLKSLQAQEDALRALVGQAKAVNDVLQVQQSLFSVRQQIEQLTAQKANLEQSVSLATFQVSLYEPGALGEVRPVTDDRSLAHSVRQAVDGMVAVVGGMIVVVGYLVPLAVLGLLGWGASRVFRRRPAGPVVPVA
jgi:hypothetical protein